jgi:hypothetical protein
MSGKFRCTTCGQFVKSISAHKKKCATPMPPNHSLNPDGPDGPRD